MAGNAKADLARAIAKEKKALDAGVITRAEYNSRLAQLTRRFESASGMAEKISAQGKAAAAKPRPGTAVVPRRSSAVASPKGSSVVPRPTSDMVKFISEGASKASFLTKFAKVLGHAGNAAMIYDTVKNPDFGKKKLDAWRKNNPNATAAEKLGTAARNAVGMGFLPSNARVVKNASQHAAVRRPADKGDRSSMAAKPTPVAKSVSKPASKVTPKSSTAAKKTAAVTPMSGNVHVVKSGDTLWDIAQANKTTVKTLLALNPIIAKRKKAGKVDIFSGSKVRLPNGKK